MTPNFRDLTKSDILNITPNLFIVDLINIEYFHVFRKEKPLLESLMKTPN
jgi:hypothetical protein